MAVLAENKATGKGKTFSPWRPNTNYLRVVSQIPTRRFYTFAGKYIELAEPLLMSVNKLIIASIKVYSRMM